MLINSSIISCGVYQLGSIYSMWETRRCSFPNCKDERCIVVNQTMNFGIGPNRLFKKLVVDGWKDGVMLIFSDADAFYNGRALEAYINYYKLGELTRISGVNPNSGNDISTWIWKIDQNALQRHINNLPADSSTPKGPVDCVNFIKQKEANARA